MKKLLFIWIFIYSINSITAQNPNFEWVKVNKTYYPYNGGVTALSVYIDSLKNIYTIGQFSGRIDFNPHPNFYLFIGHDTIQNNFYIQKLDSNGNYVWVRNIIGINGNTIKVDYEGSLYITGYFMGTVDFDPDTSVYNLTSNGQEDVFILKLDANGYFVWAKSFGGNGQDKAFSMAIDKDNNIYTTGDYNGNVDFDPSSAVFTMNSTHSSFIHKMDKNGNFIWAKELSAIEQTSICSSRSISLDNNGNIYTTGDFSGIIDFDPSSSSFYSPNNGIASNYFALKLDSLGVLSWVKFSKNHVIGGSAIGLDITLDKSSNVYMTGKYHGSALIDFDPGPDTFYLPTNTSTYEIFIQKLDKNGDFQWAKALVGNGFNQGNSILTDTFGNVYSIGSFQDSADFDPSLDTFFLTTHGVNSNYGTYLVKLNNNGNLIYAKQLQGNSGISHGGSFVNDLDGNLYLNGFFMDTVDFDPGSSIHNLISDIGFASYTLKLSQSKILTTDSIIACDSLVWIDSNTYYQSNNSAYKYFVSSTGYDSIVFLSLNIPEIDTTISLSSNGKSFISNQLNASYQWLDCNNAFNAIAGDTLQIFTPTANGDYSVEIKLYGCLDTSVCRNINNVSIDDIEPNAVIIYPNPNLGKFTLELGNNPAKEVRILNSLGQELMFKENISKQSFDLELSAGIYYAVIKFRNSNKVIKFVVN
jgi:hypothetical protein